MEIQDLYKLFLQHPTVTTDSRDVPQGSIFFALKGETFDGNQYAEASLQKGAAYAVVDDPTVATRENILLVDDVLQTLQQLASYHRQQLGTTIIGITGTNGKTTTKELIAAVLQKKYKVLYTQGNFNNHIGVPKTLLQLTAEHEMAVIEMGANHPGEIKTLVNIVQPDFGIITNVGKAHLLGFGSFEGVIKTKGELYDFLRSDDGTVFINNDNEHLKGISHDLTLVKYGQQPADDLLVQGELVECNPFVKFRWTPQFSILETDDIKIKPTLLEEVNLPSSVVQTHLIGSYNVDNLLAAACIGTFFTVPAEDISTALAEYTPTNNRSQMTVTADNQLVVDAYNANPTSMAAALQNFSHIKVAHKMAILGDMRELGEASLQEHTKILESLFRSDFEQVWLVGEEFQKAVNHAPCTSHIEFRTFSNVEEVKTALAANKPKGYTILIKGSNSMKLVQAVECL